jgi:hypothetical protein
LYIQCIVKLIDIIFNCISQCTCLMYVTKQQQQKRLNWEIRGGCAAVSRERRWKEEEQSNTRKKKIDKGGEIESRKQNGNTSLNLISTFSFNSMTHIHSHMICYLSLPLSLSPSYIYIYTGTDPEVSSSGVTTKLHH